MIEEQLLVTNPFPGLRRFEMGEGHLFFGRDGHCDDLLETLRTTRFAVVVGTSGSGKSSLVRAGILPALKSGFMRSAGANWRFAIFRPGNHPIGNLAKALNAPNATGTGEGDLDLSSSAIEATLRSSSFGLIEAVRPKLTESSESLVVVVDQFEELYRFQSDSAEIASKDEAAAFVKLLLEAAAQKESPIYVVLSVRSEYLGESARFWGLPEAINDGQYLIPRMTDDERREAIVGPITVCGGEITRPLINRLLNDAGHNRAPLPILQHALMRTWDYWKQSDDSSTPLDIPHYEKIGGMAEALSLHADEAYYELSERNQQVAEKLFKCLTEKGAVSDGNRRHATLGQICAVAEASLDEVSKVVDVFRRQGRSFLLPSPGVSLQPTTPIDISHESLIQGWERLSAWVDDEALSARIYQRLAEGAALHRDGEAALLINPGLQVTLDWRAKYQPNKAWAQRYNVDFDLAMNYLDKSKLHADIELREKEKGNRRRLIVVSIAAIIFGLLFLAMIVFYFQAEKGKKYFQQLQELTETGKRAAQARAKEAEQNAYEIESARRAAILLKITADNERDAAIKAQQLAETRQREKMKLTMFAAGQGRALEATGRELEAESRLTELVAAVLTASSGNKTEGQNFEEVPPPPPTQSKTVVNDPDQTPSHEAKDKSAASEKPDYSFAALRRQHKELIDAYARLYPINKEGKEAPRTQPHFLIARNIVRVGVKSRNTDLSEVLDYIEEISKQVSRQTDASPEGGEGGSNLTLFDRQQQADLYMDVCDEIEISTFLSAEIAIPIYDRAIALLDVSKDANRIAFILIKKGDALFRFRRPAEGIESYNRAKKISEGEVDNDTGEGDGQAFETLANADKKLGRCDEALQNYRLALNRYIQLGKRDPKRRNPNKESLIQTEIKQIKDCKP